MCVKFFPKKIAAWIFVRRLALRNTGVMPGVNRRNSAKSFGQDGMSASARHAFRLERPAIRSFCTLEIRLGVILKVSKIDERPELFHWGTMRRRQRHREVVLALANFAALASDQPAAFNPATRSSMRWRR